MPEHDEPRWPSADENAADAAQAYDGGRTEELAGPAITRSAEPREEQPTSWFNLGKAVGSPAPSLRAEPSRQAPPIPAAPFAVPMRIEPTGEFYPAEATTGVETAFPRELSGDHTPVDPARSEPQSPPPPKAKRRRGGLLSGTLALLLAAALGVAATIPQVANRLELPWAPNKPRNPPPQPAAVTRLLLGPEVSAAAPTPDGVAKVLAAPSGSAALGKLTGSVLDPATGTVLWDRGAGQPFTAASTTKLLTAAAALLALDHDLRLPTKVVQGAQPGTVVLLGGGDPTLNSLPIGKDSLYPGAARLDDLIEQVKKATGGEVKKVQLDVSAYAGPVTAPGWADGDAPSTYAAPVVPVMLDGGRVEPTVERSMRIANPATAVAQQLAQRFGAQVQGIATAGPGARVLGEVTSAPLAELVHTALLHSDNTLADAIARQTAIVKGAEPSFAGAAKATIDVLSQNGFDLAGVALSDGSGLSSLDKIPAKVLSQVIAVAAGRIGQDPRTAKLRGLLDDLPVAGGSGTLSTRYTDADTTSGRGWLRAKTGTLAGVNTLAGLVLDIDGRVLVFALMSSGGTDQEDARTALDAVAATLRGCGCR